ncbi:hypothetical protein C8F01DRAFT_1254034 [Mycena amicta]|nr:hypothetical protein C8F01DRAFT_1254034 [Mycena amicta]
MAQKSLCRPHFYADPGLENLKSDPHVAVPFQVVLNGASPGAYTSRELVEAESQGEPLLCCEVTSWHEVLRLWAGHCFFHHQHLDERYMQTTRWMKITHRKPLPHPPHPPNSPAVEPPPASPLLVFQDLRDEEDASPSSSFAASEVDSEARSFEARSFATWPSSAPTLSPPSSDPGDVRFEDFSSARAAAEFVLEECHAMEPVAAEPIATEPIVEEAAATSARYEVEVATRQSFRSW